MVNDEILYIRRRLKKKMDEDRFEHTIGVAYTSVCLAMRSFFTTPTISP